MIHLIFSMHGYAECLKIATPEDRVVILCEEAEAGKIDDSVLSEDLPSYSELSPEQLLLALIAGETARSWY